MVDTISLSGYLSPAEPTAVPGKAGIQSQARAVRSERRSDKHHMI